jgi:hypothetical protein
LACDAARPCAIWIASAVASAWSARECEHVAQSLTFKELRHDVRRAVLVRTNTAITFGWFSVAAAPPTRNCNRSALPAMPAARTFNATSRFRRASRAR